MKGYVNFTLATSPYNGWLSEGKDECRYRAFRDDEGNFTPSHYKILGLKLAFVIIFEVSIIFGIFMGICNQINKYIFVKNFKLKLTLYRFSFTILACGIWNLQIDWFGCTRHSRVTWCEDKTRAVSSQGGFTRCRPCSSGKKDIFLFSTNSWSNVNKQLIKI